MSNGKSFIHQRACGSDFFSNSKKKKKRKKKVIEIFGVNDMDMLHFKVWKVLLYYYLMPEILGTHKKSQMINHNLPRKIAIIKVITFYMATC